MNASQNTQVATSSVLDSLRRRIAQLARDRRGAAFTEYIIIVGIVALLGMTIFTGFRNKISSAVGKQGTSVDSLGNGVTAN